MPQALTDRAILYTVGHSNRPLDEFIALLREYKIERLVDVRTVPRSRHNPQFNKESLPHALDNAGIEYSHVAALGGLKSPRADSVNLGWRNESFRGYADYMQTEPFAKAVDALVAQATNERVAIMCAEAVPWRCHRSLIADALLVRGVKVQDIFNRGHLKEHALTSFAKVRGTQITYPPESPQQSLFG